MTTGPITLTRLIPEEHRLDELRGTSPERVIGELLDCFVRAGTLGVDAVDAVRRAIVSREREATTGIGHGLAIPHMKECVHVRQLCAAFGRSRAGVDYGATDGAPVHVFFLMLTPPGAEQDHVRMMRKIVSLSRDRNVMHHITHADPLANLQAIFEDADARIP